MTKSEVSSVGKTREQCWWSAATLLAENGGTVWLILTKLIVHLCYLGLSIPGPICVGVLQGSWGYLKAGGSWADFSCSCDSVMCKKHSKLGDSPLPFSGDSLYTKDGL